ncbi:hypothetical protein BDP27DRAFT_1320290 [Rhodocollybia butyracea]|uniref:Uncharacterized protein n=1 Tax=Rhodocollybia butyracea TaxID=206335 RepID=A0A9P5Q218_9AGAR|nr:hypothetical protein BDP27DRAFT_1320290 [Rhodocollybia butyracea]
MDTYSLCRKSYVQFGIHILEAHTYFQVSYQGYHQSMHVNYCTERSQSTTNVFDKHHPRLMPVIYTPGDHQSKLQVSFYASKGRKINIKKSKALVYEDSMPSDLCQKIQTYCRYTIIVQDTGTQSTGSECDLVATVHLLQKTSSDKYGVASPDIQLPVYQNMVPKPSFTITEDSIVQIDIPPEYRPIVFAGSYRPHQKVMHLEYSGDGLDTSTDTILESRLGSLDDLVDRTGPLHEIPVHYTAVQCQAHLDISFYRLELQNTNVGTTLKSWKKAGRSKVSVYEDSSSMIPQLGQYIQNYYRYTIFVQEAAASTGRDLVATIHLVQTSPGSSTPPKAPENTGFKYDDTLDIPSPRTAENYPYLFFSFLFFFIIYFFGGTLSSEEL